MTELSKWIEEARGKVTLTDPNSVRMHPSEYLMFLDIVEAAEKTATRENLCTLRCRWGHGETSPVNLTMSKGEWENLFLSLSNLKALIGDEKSTREQLIEWNRNQRQVGQKVTERAAPVLPRDGEAEDGCYRCADWSRMGLSNTCPSCDLASLSTPPNSGDGE